MTKTPKPPLPDEVRTFLDEIAAWAVARGESTRWGDSSHAGTQRLFFGFSSAEGPASGFAADPMPPLREGGDWVVEIYDLSTLDTLVAYHRDGRWLANVPPLSANAAPTPLTADTLPGVLDEIRGGTLVTA